MIKSILWVEDRCMPVVSYRSPAPSLDAAVSQKETNDKLLSFLDLQDGWCYGEGRAPSRTMVDLLVKINDFVFSIGFSKTDAFPRVNGVIVLSIYEGDFLIDLSMNPSGDTCSLSMERNEVEILDEEDISLRDAIKHLESAGTTCRLYDASISATTRAMKGVLKAKPSKHPMTVEYPFFPLNAPLEYPGQFAVTWISFIPDTQWTEMRPSTGRSKSPIYHLEQVVNQR